MKVTHSNQTLILASERRGRGAKPENTLDQAVSAASKGGTLKRVTIVAAQPDSAPAGLVYLQADYATDRASGASATSDAQPTGTALVAISRSLTRTSVSGAPSPSASSSGSEPAGTPTVAISRSLTRTSGPGVGTSVVAVGGSSSRDNYGNVQASSREHALSAYLTPTEQYARTQRISTGSAPRSGLIDVLA